MTKHRGRITVDGIRIHDPADFEGMRKAGALAASILDALCPMVGVGQTTGELNRVIEQMVDDAGAKSATIGYRGYPYASCISVNHVVCHGFPGDKIRKWKNDPHKRVDDTLLDGDILNVDVTVIVDGWYGDTSRMYVAGKAKPYAKKLIQVTHDSLMRAIDVVRPGATFGDIGHAIQTHAESLRMGVVRDFCGHGLGTVFHAPPNVLHYVQPVPPPPVLEEGMFFTIEPMINLGRPDTKVLDDDWTAITVDKSLSAQFEHSIGVTATGCEVFTLSPKGLFHPTS